MRRWRSTMLPSPSGRKRVATPPSAESISPFVRASSSRSSARRAAGKSTILNAAAGLLKPSAGKVEIFGNDLAGLNLRAGYLFQQDALMPWKTALDNVAVALEPKGVSRSEALQRARDWLAPRRARSLRRPLSAHALRRAAQARRAGADADPRSGNPADGRALRTARRADAADHGQPAAEPVGGGPQGGDVRHARSRGGDRAGRPRRA